MDDWRAIDTVPEELILYGPLHDVWLWNGKRVHLGWFDLSDGWHESGVAEYVDYPLEPQPTHWMPLDRPQPPRGQVGASA